MKTKIHPSTIIIRYSISLPQQETRIPLLAPSETLRPEFRIHASRILTQAESARCGASRIADISLDMGPPYYRLTDVQYVWYIQCAQEGAREHFSKDPPGWDSVWQGIWISRPVRGGLREFLV